MKASVNVNDHVWVRLTTFGEQVLREDVEEAYRNMVNKTERDKNVDSAISKLYETTQGWTRFHLHDLMRIFGKTMYMGSTDQVIEENIISLTAMPYDF